jgi:dihydrodipicolinate synthase/N-acetylneuraminate lyase
MLLESLHIPLTTPFHPDGRLNPGKLAANVARYSRTPAAGLIVLAPSANPTLLSDEETHETLRAAASAAAPEKVLLAGISRDSVSATLTLADLAASLDYDAALIAPPSIPLSTRELLTFFQTIADRSPLPVVLSTTPLRAIPHDLIVTLAAHPNIVAAIDSASSASEIVALHQRTASIRREVAVTSTFAAVTARMKKAAAQSPASDFISAESLTENATGLLDALDPAAAIEIIAAPPAPFISASAPLRTRTKSVGFQLLAASTPTLLDALRAGATGIAPAFAAAAPQATYEIFAAWKDDDQPLADEKQARLLSPARLAESTPGLLAYACDLNGYFGGLPRPPLLPPTGDDRTHLERLLQPLRN